MSYNSICLILTIAFAIFAFSKRDKAVILSIVLFFTLELFSIANFLPIWGVVAICTFLPLLKNKEGLVLPLSKPIFFILLSYILTTLFGSYAANSQVLVCVYYILLTYVIYNNFSVNEKNVKYLLWAVIIYTVVSIIYGAYESIMFQKPFRDWLISIGGNLNDQGLGQQRYGLWRAQGFTAWFTFFSLMCCISYSILTDIVLVDKYKFARNSIIVSLCFVFLAGTILAGDRSSMVFALIISLSFIGVFKHQRGLLVFVLLVTFLLFIVFSSLFNEIYSSFFITDDMDGSHKDMRIEQFKAAYDFFLLNPIFGNGLGSLDAAISYNPELRGSESQLFNILYGRGIFGVLTSGYLFFKTLQFFYRQKTYSLLFIYLGFFTYNCLTLPINELFIYPVLFLLYRIKTVINNDAG